MESTREPYREKEEMPVQRTSASFVLGILSLAFLFVSPQIVSLILGIAGLSIGARDKKPGSGRIRGEEGWIMSLIGTVLSSLILVLELIILIVFLLAFLEGIHW